MRWCDNRSNPRARTKDMCPTWTDLQWRQSKQTIDSRSTLVIIPTSTKKDSTHHRHHYKHFAQCCHRTSQDPIPDDNDQRHLSSVQSKHRMNWFMRMMRDKFKKSLIERSAADVGQKSRWSWTYCDADTSDSDLSIGQSVVPKLDDGFRVRGRQKLEKRMMLVRFHTARWE